MKEQGFTLIELLAVIVILAIIALIATPIVLNIIANTKENAQLRSAEMYLDAVEQLISMEKMTDTTFNPNKCTITNEGNLYCDGYQNKIEVKVNGEKPNNGKITFIKGKITQVELKYENGKTIVMNNKGQLQYKNYVSISNYQHQHTNGTIEDHEVTFDENGHGICSICMEEVLAAGLYDENNNLVASWDTLVNDHGLDIEKDGVGTPLAYEQPEYSLSKILLNNQVLSDGTKLIIGSEVNNIGVAQVVGTTLSEVIISNSVINIGDYAFSGCTGLTTIDLGNSVTSIGNDAFSGCTGLISIDLGNSVTSIGNYAFSGCTGLISIDLGNSVTSIGNYAFSGCKSLTSIDLGNSVTSITKYAFQGCTGLTTIDLGNSVTSIGNDAFSGCTGLISIDLGNSVTGIGDRAFSGCTSLTSIVLPKSLRSIGMGAFASTSINTIYYTGSEAEWANLGIGSGQFYGSVPTNIQYNYVAS